MNDADTKNRHGAGLWEPTRNAYRHGQLLGVHNFELETDYGIRQRRLLNRLVLGYGVVCGLDVELSRDGDEVVIGPGLAIDGCGYETIVPGRSHPIPIPNDVVESAVERARGRREDPCVQVAICYHECRDDPVPSHAGDCAPVHPCAASAVRERYRIEFRDEPARKPEPRCHVPDLVSHWRIDQDELAEWVTRGRNCTRLPGDPCIPLANLTVVDSDKAPHCDPREVDIGVRPVLFSNVALTELVTALLDDLG